MGPTAKFDKAVHERTGFHLAEQSPLERQRPRFRHDTAVEEADESR